MHDASVIELVPTTVRTARERLSGIIGTECQENDARRVADDVARP
jgi:hypothetical protein